MIQEALVLLACAQSQGCSQTTSAYYANHPEVKHTVDLDSNKVKTAVGPVVVAAAPVLLFPLHHKATIPITKYLALQVSERDGGKIILQFSF